MSAAEDHLVEISINDASHQVATAARKLLRLLQEGCAEAAAQTAVKRGKGARRR